MTRLILFYCVLALVSPALAQDRPNIMWITSEDNSHHWLGCYGNEQAKTPNLDKLAADGIRYKYAYSNGAVCAVARFTLISGRYAPSMGTQNMRSRYPIPEQFKTYAHYMREAGYYCVNKSKTDYNFKTNDRSHWDECSGGAHWKKGPKGKPFFAVFNTTISHESSLFGQKTKSYRKSGKIPKTPRVDPASVALPPYLPDTPEIRQDWVTYLDIVTAMDEQVGKWLKELDDAGVADNTIVFYYSDHGGILPRAKRYIYDTGNHVPLIVRFPKKWAHLAPSAAGTTSDRPVGFIDLPPTVFSLAGVKIPPQFQGRPFLGKAKQKAEPFVFLYGQRFDARMIRFVRGVTNGRYRYVRNFNPHLHRGIFAGYPYGQAGWKSLGKTRRDGKLNTAQESFWRKPQPVEELYDTQSDPWEVKNLANSPEHQSQLKLMRQAVLDKMTEIRDTGVVPEAMYKEISANGTIYDYVNSKDFPYAKVFALAQSATDSADLDTLKSAMADDHPVMRYWGAIGCTVMGDAAAPAKAELTKLLNDERFAVRIAAAEAIATLGDTAAAIKTLADILKSSRDEMVVLTALNTIEALGLRKEFPKDVFAKGTSVGGYPGRLKSPIVE